MCPGLGGSSPSPSPGATPPARSSPPGEARRAEALVRPLGARRRERPCRWDACVTVWFPRRRPTCEELADTPSGTAAGASLPFSVCFCGMSNWQPDYEVLVGITAAIGSAFDRCPFPFSKHWVCQKF